MARDLGAGQLPLKGLVAPLDLGDELGDVVLRLDGFGRNDAAFLVEIAADESDAGQQLLRGIGGKIKYGIFLANLCGDHDSSFG